jgi:hypothetical protein
MFFSRNQKEITTKSQNQELPFHFSFSHPSRSQQALIKGEQRLVDFKNIILFLPDEILDDNVELAAGAEGVACATALLGRTF